MNTRSVWLMRMDPEGHDLVPQARSAGLLLTGWSQANRLVQLTDKEAFREHGILAYMPEAERPWTRSQLQWIDGAYRVLHVIKPGDLVVVPHGDHFYICAVTGTAFYQDGVRDDSAHRRPAVWLTGPIPRAAADDMRPSFYFAGTCCSLNQHKGAVWSLLNRYGQPGWQGRLR